MLKQTALGAVAGLALASFVGYHVIYAPQQRQVRKLRQRVAEEQANQEAQQQAMALLDQLERARKQLAPEPEPSWLVREVTAIGRSAGMDLTTISPQLPQTYQQFIRLTVSLQFDASYHQLGRFIDEIERAPHALRIERVDVGHAGRDTAASKVPIQLEISTLYLAPEVPGTAAGSGGGHTKKAATPIPESRGRTVPGSPAGGAPTEHDFGPATIGN